MDGVFWYGIAIGAVLSLIASVIANLLSSRIQNALDKGRADLSARRERKLARTHRLVEKIHSGRRDKTGFFVVGSTLAIIATQISVFAFAFVVYL